MTRSFLVMLTLLFLARPALAGILDLNFAYANDSVKTATTTTNSLMAYDFALGIPIGKRDIYVSFAYGAYTSTFNPGTATTWNGTDMGLKFTGFFGRGKLFTSSLTYNLKSTVKYKTDSSNVELRGTSLRFDLGVNYWFADNAAISAKLFYYSPTLGEEIDSTTLNTVSYARTTMGQCIGLSWIF